jgi:hypothetical protein
MTDTHKPTLTDKPAETDDGSGLEYAPLLLILPAAMVLAIWDNVTWAAWTAFTVGLLGLALTPVALYYAKRDGKIKLWAYVVLALITTKFVGGAWAFLA